MLGTLRGVVKMALWYGRKDAMKWLFGSVRHDLEPDERSVWDDLMQLAAINPDETRRGIIEIRAGVPYPKQRLLDIFNIKEELFDRTVAKCVKEGRLKINDDGTMTLTNWLKYNDLSEYEAKKQKQKDFAGKSKGKSRKNRHGIEAALEGTTRAANRLSTEVHQHVDGDKNFTVVGTKLVNLHSGEITEIEVEPKKAGA